MADSTDTASPGETEAVDAAAQAEYSDCYMGRPDVPWESLDPDLKRQLRNVVRGGVAVVYPIIAAAVREQVAQEIVEWARSGIFVPYGDYEGEALDFADRVAEGGR